MRDDTVCEKCDGTEGPVIVAASILLPIIIVGVPLLVMRLERTRTYTCECASSPPSRVVAHSCDDAWRRPSLQSMV